MQLLLELFDLPVLLVDDVEDALVDVLVELLFNLHLLARRDAPVRD